MDNSTPCTIDLLNFMSQYYRRKRSEGGEGKGKEEDRKFFL